MLENLPESAYWMALHRIDGVGPSTFLKLLKHYGSPQQVFRNADQIRFKDLGLNPQLARQIRNFDGSGPPGSKLESDLRWLEGNNNHLLTYIDPDYPVLLKKIANPPPLLFIRGNRGWLSRLQIAMVGNRSSTLLGRETARAFARQLSNAGLIVTSGLALGIDAESHRGAMLGSLPTLAVLGSGVDQIYPARHRKLADQILQDGGSIVSEFALGSGALPANFPRRNRIISGLSLGTLVVEANLRSGSLITARYAAEQNREVFAIPGSIHNKGSRGCHELIRQGAKLVETIEDILEELTGLSDYQISNIHTLESAPEEQVHSPQEAQVLELLHQGSLSLDSLVESTNLPVSQMTSMLVALELKGLIRPDAGGFTLIPSSLRL
jgi:DNA processing protein